MKREPTEADVLMWEQLKELVGRAAMREYQCCERKWKFDFAFVSGLTRIAVEINGSVWTGGRHTRGAGYVKDLEKLNHAQGLFRWTVLQFTPQQVLKGEAIAFIRKVLES